MAIRHFLTLRDLNASEFNYIIKLAIEMKAARREGRQEKIFDGKVLGMIFEKSSTRTRVSFEAGMAQLGGDALFLSPNDSQLGRGEPIEDSASVISRMVDIVMIRTFGHDIIERFAQYSKVPVINALTDQYHPCQLLADIQTYTEHRGSIEGKTVAWIGDGNNNMSNSLIEAAGKFNFNLKIGCPDKYKPGKKIMLWAKKNKVKLELFKNPKEAVKNSDCIMTDKWVSMNDKVNKKLKKKSLNKYQVNKELIKLAKKDAIFMHCLPVVRGEEVTNGIIDGKQSVVWRQALNRVHVQKSIIMWCLN